MLDHPHHTLFIILALANANRDQEFLQGRQSKKAGGKLSRGMSQTAEEEVSSSIGFVPSMKASQTVGVNRP